MKLPAVAKVSPLSLFVSPLFASELDAAERAAVAAALSGQPGGRDLARLPALAPLVGQIEAAAEAAFAELKCEQRGAVVTRLWIETGLPGTAGQRLVHPNAYLGGLYRPEGETPESVTFEDPRPQAALLQAPIEAPTPLTATEAGVPLVAGRLLLFPAYLKHQPAPGSGPRRLVRFAVSFRDFVRQMSLPRWTGMTAGRED